MQRRIWERKAPLAMSLRVSRASCFICQRVTSALSTCLVCHGEVSATWCAPESRGPAPGLEVLDLVTNALEGNDGCSWQAPHLRPLLDALEVVEGGVECVERRPALPDGPGQGAHWRRRGGEDGVDLLRPPEQHASC
eukprot:6723530-Pyramimonas_sp.AAC.1